MKYQPRIGGFEMGGESQNLGCPGLAGGGPRQMHDVGHDLAGPDACVIVQSLVGEQSFHGGAIGKGCHARVAATAQPTFEVVPGRHRGGA